MNNSITIAVAGNNGSFSHEAGMLYITGHKLEDVRFIFGIDSPGAFKAMRDGKAQKIIVPIYNTTGGLVHMTLQAMGLYQFSIEEMFDMKIDQCIMLHDDAQADEIERVASHPQALRQCHDYLQEQWPKRELQEYQDTAQAAKDLSDGKLSKRTAVIAPKLSAELYDLTIAGEAIQDDPNNATTFLVIAPH